MPASERVIVGAYALTANMRNRQDFTERDFLERIASWSMIRGLELPYRLAEEDRDGLVLVPWLPRTWEHVVTLLPLTMQQLTRSVTYGLASQHEEGRRAAIYDVRQLWEKVDALRQRLGYSAVRALHLHSAPKGSVTGVASSSKFLRDSLTEILRWDWSGIDLLIEHCDAVRSQHEASKGFLELEDEMAVASVLGLGMSVNWGRSLVETRSVLGAQQQLAAVVQAGFCRGLMVSGSAVTDPLYGTFEDNHAPIFGDTGAAWEARGSLLSAAVLKDILATAPPEQLLFLGLKVQPYPTSLTGEQRIAFLEEQLGLLQASLRAVARPNGDAQFSV